MKKAAIKFYIAFLVSFIIVVSASASDQTQESNKSLNPSSQKISTQQLESMMKKWEEQFRRRQAGKPSNLSPEELKKLQEESKLIQERLRQSISTKEYRPSDKKKPVSKKEYYAEQERVRKKKKRKNIVKKKNVVAQVQPETLPIRTQNSVSAVSIPGDDLIIGVWKDKDNKIVEFKSNGQVKHGDDISMFKRYNLNKWKVINDTIILKKRDPKVSLRQTVIISVPSVSKKVLTVRLTTAYGSLNSKFVRVSLLKKLVVFRKPVITYREHKLSLQTGHTNQVELVSFSPDGKYIVSYGKSKSLIIWDKESGRQIRSFIPASCEVTVNYLGAGKLYLGTNSAWRTKVKVIDGIPCEGEIIQKHLSKGNTIDHFSERKDVIDSLSFSPDGKYILTSGTDQHLKLYNVRTGNVEVSYNSQETKYEFGSIQKSNFSDSGKYIVTAGFHPQAEIGIWNVKTSELLKIIKTDTGYFSYVNFMPGSDNRIVSVENQGEHGPGSIKFWDVKNSKLIRKISAHTKRVTAVSISRNGKLIISGSENGELIVWNVATGKMIKSIKRAPKRILKLSFFSDNNRVLVSSENNVQILQLNTNKLESLFKNAERVINATAMDKKGEYLAVSHEGEAILSLWSMRNKNLVRRLVSYTKSVGRVRFNSENNRIIMFSSPPRYWDLTTGREGSDKNFLADLSKNVTKDNISKNKRRHPMMLAPPPVRGQRLPKISKTSPNGMLEVTTGSSSGFSQDHFILLNKKTGRKACHLSHPQRGAYGSVGNVKFSRNSNFLIGERKTSSGIIGRRNISYPENTRVFIWDVKTCRVVESFQQTQRTIDLNILLDSPDGKHVILENEHRNLVVYKVADNIRKTTTAVYNWPPGSSPNLIVKQTLSGFKGDIESAQFSKDSNRLITGGIDIKITIWDVGTGSRIVTILPLVNGKDSIIYTPNNRYISTKHAFNALAINKGMETFSFEQFDLTLNRPDLVLESLLGRKSKVTRLYYQAYIKRLKKLDFTPKMLKADFHVPELNISNREDIPVSTTKDNITLNINARDKKYKLKTLNVWVNDVPYFGSKGIDLSKKNMNILSRKIVITLSQGNNKIQVSVSNKNGIESTKVEKYVLLNVPKTKPDLHIVAIGVSKYKNNKMDLNYAAKDATDFIDTFASKKDLYNKIHIHKYTDKEATLDNIRKLKEKLLKTKVDDRVLLFYAGHGLLDKNFDYFLATHNVNFNNPSDAGLAYEQLETLIDGIPARHKVIFIDACHSGEVDKDEVITKLSSYVKKGSPVKFSRGFESTSKRQIVGLSNSFALARELFVDLKRRSGATVISSAGGAELAVENDKWKNGVFSYCLFDGLRKNRIDSNNNNKTMVSELQGYLLQCVSNLTNDLQKPTSRAENLSNDFQIW